MEDDNDNSPPNSVECDPHKRYWRFEDVLGRGAFKTVFKAFDSREGIEVAWNKVVLGNAVNEDPIRKRLNLEIHVLKRLKHKNIMTFHDYWLDEKTNTLNFITELFTHGSLKKFRARHKHLELKVLKKWAWQILQGLVYLHGHEPPIIHRDLKCDNILINGVTGDLKIGDLGLVTLLWKGLAAPLSVIGTPEFMAPEFYDEQYDEKVDVYAFGMLLLELVSMDYPYCECSNPVAIYKKVSQGVFPASIQKIRNEALRKFIELCIAYEPSKRPEARKLLKHPFFDSVREEKSSERQTCDDLEGEQLIRGSEAGSSSDESARVENISRRSSAMHTDTPSEPETEANYADDDDHFPSVATSDGVKIKIGCRKEGNGPLLYFTLMIAKPGGVSKNIEFPFNIEDDTAEAVVAEMREETSGDWNILISEEEAIAIGNLIATEVEKWRADEDEGDLTAFVSVTRKTCEALSEAQTELQPANSLEAREELEWKMGDMCQKIASNSNTETVFQAMHETNGPLWTIMKSDNNRHPWMHASERISDEFYSDGVLTQPNVFFMKSFEQQQPDETDAPDEDYSQQQPFDTMASGAIDIPKKRRTSGPSCLETSHSISSTVSDSRIQLDQPTSASISRSIKRHLPIRRGSSEGPSNGQPRPAFIKALSMKVDNVSVVVDSPETGRSPQPPVAFAACMVGPTTPPETPSSGMIEGTVETGSGSDPRQASLISFVSLTKPTPKKGSDLQMPTVPEATAALNPFPSSRLKPDKAVVRSRADEWQWMLANGLTATTTDNESAINPSLTTSAGASPQNSFVNRNDSSGSMNDHGLKSPQLSQDLDSCGRSDVNVPGQRSTEMKSGPSSTGGLEHSIEDYRHYVETAQLNHRVRETKRALIDGLSSDVRPMTLDSAIGHISPPPYVLSSPPPDCRSAYEFGESWRTDAIRAFRKEEAEAVVSTSGTTSADRSWPSEQISTKAKQNVDRMFSSCADLSKLLQEPNETHRFPFFPSQTTNSANGMHPSSSDARLVQMAKQQSHSDSHHRTEGSFNDAPKTTGKLTATSDDAFGWLSSVDFQLDTRKQEVTRAKEILRQKASENIDKMQEQQLVGLCSHAAVGVASSKPSGGRKTQRPSMNGTTTYP